MLEFFRTPFFDNAAALKCRLAAMCLTLPHRVTCSVRSHGFMDTNGPGRRRTSLIAKLQAVTVSWT